MKRDTALTSRSQIFFWRILSTEGRLQENLRREVLILLEKIREVCDRHRQFSFEKRSGDRSVREFKEFKILEKKFCKELDKFKVEIEATLRDVEGKLGSFDANREKFFSSLEARVKHELAQAKAQLDEKNIWQERCAKENTAGLAEIGKADSAAMVSRSEEYISSLNYQALRSKDFYDRLQKNLRSLYFFNSVKEKYSADPESLEKFLIDFKVILESNLTAIGLIEKFIKKHFSGIEKLFDPDNGEEIIEEREDLELMGSFFTDLQILFRALNENKPSVKFDVGKYGEFVEEMRAVGGEDFLPMLSSDPDGKKITDLFFNSPKFSFKFLDLVKEFAELYSFWGILSFRGIEFYLSIYEATICDNNFYRFNFEPKNTAEAEVDLSEYSISTEDAMKTVENLLGYAKFLLEKQKQLTSIRDLLLETFESELNSIIKYLEYEGCFSLFSKIFRLIVAITGVSKSEEKEMTTAFEEGLYELARQRLVNNPDAVQTLAINIISGLDVSGELLEK